jgi:sugar phosphate isomerase/epimerase
MTEIELAITPDGRWRCDTDELVAAAREAGFGALGILGSAADAVAAETFRRAGLRCHEVLALVTTDDEEATLAAAGPLADAAATMHADWVLTVFAAPLTEDTASIVQRCAEMFTEAGAGMAVEFSPLGPVGTLRAGCDVVRAARRRGARAGLMIDTWHFSFGANEWAELEALEPEDVAYVQFCDALAPASEKLGHETMNRRALPGEGVLDVGRFASTLRELGYAGTVSVEVLSAELRELPVDEIARRIFATTAPYWR